MPGRLRRAVLGKKGDLSPEARAEIQGLSGARPLRFMAELLLNWTLIAALIGLGVYSSNLGVTLLCVVLLGWRQFVLGLMLHEQVHRLGLRGKYGDWLVNLLAAYPILFTTVEDYAKVHLMHHKYFFTGRDPDHLRKSGPEWTFPMPLRQLLTIVLRDLTGLNTLRTIKGKTAPKNAEEFERKHPTPRALRWLFLALVAGVLTLIDGWTHFLIYWVLPLMTTAQLFLRWIAVSEHLYNAENAECLDVTPLIRLKPWQRIMLPDLNFAMHAYHHEHPGVSFSCLPKVHAIYKREGLVDESAVFHGAGAYLKFLIKTNPAQHSTTSKPTAL